MTGTDGTGHEEQLGRLAVAQGRRVVSVTLGSENFVTLVPGSAGLVILDPFAEDLFERLDVDGAFENPQARTQWVSHAHQAATLGVQLRREHALADAYACARFALFITARLRDAKGVPAVAGNLWTVVDQARNVLERAAGPERGPAGDPEWTVAIDRYRRDLEWLRSMAVADCRAVLSDVRAISDDDPSSSERALALHRVAQLARSELSFAVAVERLEATNDADRQLLAAAETLAQLDGESLLSLTIDKAALGDPTWARYLAHRGAALRAANAHMVGGRLAAVFRQLSVLRLRATTGGGAHAHQVSYGISARLQTVGRDLVTVLLRCGEEEEALNVSEGLLARAMVDWMGRTHAVWRIPREFRAAIDPLTGSLNAVDVVRGDEIPAVAMQMNAAILVYLRHLGGLHAWLVTPTGELRNADLGNDRSTVERVAELLPHLPAGQGGVRDASLPSGAATEKDALDRELRNLYDLLVPGEFDELLAGHRLAIVADPTLQGVPFAALRSPREKYLIEERELVLWPSVTSCLVLEAGARIPTWRRARRAGRVHPLVIGKSTFESEYPIGSERLRVPSLPGAKAEARTVGALLSADILVDADATATAMLERGSGADVIHLATHGLLDAADPMASCLLFSDGVLSAGTLYALDPGIRAGLVVLSACRTGLGGDHPDSLIGLESAFLIAGAQTVVSTLWRIADDVTVELMTAFYHHLEPDWNVSRAMRKAQIEVLTQPATSHPAFWAAFRVAGRTSISRG